MRQNGIKKRINRNFVQAQKHFCHVKLLCLSTKKSSVGQRKNTAPHRHRMRWVFHIKQGLGGNPIVEGPAGPSTIGRGDRVKRDLLFWECNLWNSTLPHAVLSN